MAMRGGHGRHGGSGVYGRPGHRTPHPVPMVVGYGGMMGMGWLLMVPLVFILFMVMLLAEVIASPIFLVGCLLLLVVIVLYQRQPKEKAKRKRGIYDDAYEVV